MIKPAKAGFFMSSVWDLSTHAVDLLDHQTRESGFLCPALGHDATSDASNVAFTPLFSFGALRASA